MTHLTYALFQLVKTEPETSKPCNACGAVKPLSEYPKAKTCADGTRNYCKACHKLRKDAWRSKNKEHHNAKGKAWVAANPEKRRAISKRYYEKAQAAGKMLEYKRAWRENNLDRARAYVSARRRKLRQATPSWVDMTAVRVIYEQASRTGQSVDHIVPLTHPDVCGLHVPWNLRVIPHRDNYQKANEFNGVRTRRRK